MKIFKNLFGTTKATAPKATTTPIKKERPTPKKTKRTKSRLATEIDKIIALDEAVIKKAKAKKVSPLQELLKDQEIQKYAQKLHKKYKTQKTACAKLNEALFTLEMLPNNKKLSAESFKKLITKAKKESPQNRLDTTAKSLWNKKKKKMLKV